MHVYEYICAKLYSKVDVFLPFYVISNFDQYFRNFMFAFGN